MASRREFRWAFVFIITLFVLGSELSAFVDSSSRPSPLKDNGSLGDYSKTLAEQFAEDPQLVVRVPGDGKDLTQLEAVFRKLLFPENRSGIEVLRDIRILRQLSDEHTIVVFRLKDQGTIDSLTETLNLVSRTVENDDPDGTAIVQTRGSIAA